MAISALAALDSMEYADADYWLAAVPVVAALAVSTLTLIVLLLPQGNRRRLVGLGAFHTVVSLAVLPALYLPALGVGAAAAVLAVFALPVIAMYLYNGSHWRL
jgi:hypothetical protein